MWRCTCASNRPLAFDQKNFWVLQTTEQRREWLQCRISLIKIIYIISTKKRQRHRSLNYEGRKICLPSFRFMQKHWKTVIIQITAISKILNLISIYYAHNQSIFRNVRILVIYLPFHGCHCVFRAAIRQTKHGFNISIRMQAKMKMFINYLRIIFKFLFTK